MPSSPGGTQTLKSIRLICAALILVLPSLVPAQTLPANREDATLASLVWGTFEDHPIRRQLGAAKEMSSAEARMWFQKMSTEPDYVTDFTGVFPEYVNASNEFERQRIAARIKSVMKQRIDSLDRETLYHVAGKITLGEYSFSDRGFPIDPSPDYYGCTYHFQDTMPRWAFSRESMLFSKEFTNQHWFFSNSLTMDESAAENLVGANPERDLMLIFVFRPVSTSVTRWFGEQKLSQLARCVQHKVFGIIVATPRGVVLKLLEPIKSYVLQESNWAFRSAKQDGRDRPEYRPQSLREVFGSRFTSFKDTTVWRLEEPPTMLVQKVGYGVERKWRVLELTPSRLRLEIDRRTETGNVIHVEEFVFAAE